VRAQVAIGDRLPELGLRLVVAAEAFQHHAELSHRPRVTGLDPPPVEVDRLVSPVVEIGQHVGGVEQPLPVPARGRLLIRLERLVVPALVRQQPAQLGPSFGVALLSGLPIQRRGLLRISRGVGTDGELEGCCFVVHGLSDVIQPARPSSSWGQQTEGAGTPTPGGPHCGRVKLRRQSHRLGAALSHSPVGQAFL
jgi:hypothetical protein